MNKIILATFFGLTIFLSSTPPLSQIYAQSPTPGQQEVTNLETQTFEGEVVRVDANKIVVRSEDQTQEFIIPENVSLQRNTFDASPTDIQTGDDLTVVYTQDGQLLSLNATSGEIMDWAQILLPAIGLGLLALIIVWYGYSRTSKSHIKTTSKETHESE